MVISRSIMYNRTKKNKDMNNNIIKSLRRTLLCTVAAAAVSIGFTACADETFITQDSPAPVNGNGYKLIVPSNIGGGDTRAIAYDETTGGFTATFETTDCIYVYDVTKTADAIKESDQGEGTWEPTFLHPDANAKNVNLEGELTFYARNQEGEYYLVTPGVGDELVLLYNNYGNSIYYYRDFSYNNLNKDGDFAIARVKIESIENGVIKTSPATFTHTQSIYKIKFTGIPSGVKIKKVTIISEQQKLVQSYSPVYESNGFNNVIYTYAEEGTDQSELTFMLRFAENPYYSSSAGDVIGFRAIASDGYYYYGTRVVEANLENGLYYNGEVAMAEDGKAMTLTNDDTGELVEINTWLNTINTTEAAYTLAGKGYNTPFYWTGGENTLTFKNFTLHNENWYNPIQLSDDAYGGEKTKEHHLLLEGVNTLYRNYQSAALDVYSQVSCSVDITAVSEGAQLNTVDASVYVENGGTMTIKSGEINIDGTLGLYSGSTVMVEGGVLTTKWVSFDDWGVSTSFIIISEGGKLRLANLPEEGRVKAAEGYLLNMETDGEYYVYTVTKDDGSGLAKSISVTPTATLYYSPSNWNTARLTAYVNPVTTENKSVTWTTSNPDVATVTEDGTVYPKSVGTAIVTATTTDGSDLSADCIVTVMPYGGIWYRNYEISMTPNNQSFINPLTIEGNITSVAYSSSDESVATVNPSTGEVTIAADASVGQTFTIKATATVEEDGKYFYPDYSRTASYTVKLVASTGEGQREDYPSGGEW